MNFKEKNLKAYNRIKLSVNSKFDSENSLVQELNFLDTPTCEIFKVNHLAWDMEMFDFPNIISPLFRPNAENVGRGVDEKFMPENSFIFKNSFTLSVAFFMEANKNEHTIARWLRAGPRKHLFFHPEEVRAAIVCCGGVCPGSNVVVQEITKSLYNNYGVKSIFGIRFGYKGFYSYDWMNLNPDVVDGIHHQGGMFLGTSRGGFDLHKIIDSLVNKGINQLYILGGLGAMQGALSLYHFIKDRKLRIAVSIIPKTIASDIPLFDTYFGFESCIEKAQCIIRSAYNECISYEYSVGIIKIIGRESGFLTVNTALGSRDIDVCLIPEIAFELYGKYGLLNFVLEKVKRDRHCIIMVSEGAGDALMDDYIPDRGTDESGNAKPGDIGLFLKEKIWDFGCKNGLNINVKYIDPTFFLRSCEPNCLDKKTATRIAQNSVHCTMAGFTGFCCGIANKNTVLIPVEETLSDRYARSILPNDPNWQRLLSSNLQPSFINEFSKYLKTSKS